MAYEGEEKRINQLHSGFNPGRRDFDRETMDLFPGIAENSIVALVQLIHQDVRSVKQNVGELDSKLDNHMKDETLELAEAIAMIMNKSFPEGDPHGHRRHHELSIKAAEDKAAFWKKMRDEITRWGLLGVLGWLSFVVWAAFVKGPVGK